MTTAIAQPTRQQEQRFRMSRAEYLAWCDEDTHAEWVRGEVTVFMPPVDVHQVVLGFLYELVASFVRIFALGEVRFAPLEVTTIPDTVYREPDLIFVARQNVHRLTDKRCEGPPDLVVEIVSPSSRKRDYVEKRQEYEQVGVGEYWIVDPRAGQERVTFYQRTPQGIYRDVPPDSEGRYHSLVLPGFWMRPAWLWQRPLPDLTAVLQEIGGQAFADSLLDSESDEHAGRLIELLNRTYAKRLRAAGNETQARRVLDMLRDLGFAEEDAETEGSNP